MPSPRAQQGFSLLEVVIVVAIAAGVVLVVGNFSTNITGLNTLIGQQLQSKSDTAQTLQILTSEIRSAGPSANGAYAIESAGTSSFIFYSDTDGSGVNERVRLFFASSSIFRGTTAPTGTPAAYPTASEVVSDLVDNVSLASGTPLFSYYDASYTGTQPALSSTLDVTPIRTVQLSFYEDSQPNQAPSPEFFNMTATIRNLRSN